MGIPDDFEFRGNKTEIARQIGNAVPPGLAGALARVVRRALDRSAPATTEAARTEVAVAAPVPV